MRFAGFSLLVLVPTFVACGPDGTGSGDHPGLLSACDPVEISTICVGPDSVASCTVENGSYKLVLQARCGADELGLDIGATAGSLTARCVDGTDSLSGQAKARCECVPGAKAEACNEAGTKRSAYECGTDGTFVKSGSGETCALGGGCRCDDTACACTAPVCPASANEACSVLMRAQCSHLLTCVASATGNCSSVVGISGKGDEAPSTADCDGLLACLTGLGNASCGGAFPVVCAEVASKTGLDCSDGKSR